MTDTSANPGIDIWGEPLDLTGFDEDGFVEAENEAGQDAEGVESEDAASAKETPEPGELDKIADELEQLADGKNTTPANKVTKGLQRVIAKKDKEIADLKKGYEALAQRVAKLDDLEEEVIQIGEATRWAGSTLLENLETDSRKDAEISLGRANSKHLEARAQRMQQRQQAVQQDQPAAWEQELQERISAEQKQFEDNLREQAILHGLKPEDPNLDFGDPNATFNQRQAAFLKSVKTAKDKQLEKDTESVRGNAVTTRGTNVGEAPPVSRNGMSSLEMGARQRTAQIRKISPL